MHYRITDKKAAEIEARADKAILSRFITRSKMQLLEDIGNLIGDRKALWAELNVITDQLKDALDKTVEMSADSIDLQAKLADIISTKDKLTIALLNVAHENNRLIEGIEIRDNKARSSSDYRNCGYCYDGCGDDCPTKTHPARKEPQQ